MQVEKSVIESLVTPTKELMGLSYQTPYKYKIEIDDRWLYCFGISHSHYPQDKQFYELKDFLIEFLEKTKRGNNCCLLESNPLPRIESINEDKIISQFGERGLMVYLCQKHKIEYVFCEETTGQDIRYLTGLSNRQTAELIVICRSLESLIKKGVDWNLAMEKSHKSLSQELLASNDELVVSLDEIENKIEKLHKKYKPKATLEIFIDWLISPMSIESPLSSMRRKLSDWRNVNLVQNIIYKLDGNKNVLVVFGSAHIYLIEPALRFLAK